ncbi:hypothetical protein NCC49_002905 [Naganishia albida]|nr:hypothetical protein NCC49_002905 [Naganishia albida]
MAPRASGAAIVLCLFQSLAGLLFGWENSSTSGLYINRYYQQRFGQCDNAACTSSSLPTLRQSTIAGCFSIGAFVGALSAGYVASHIGLRRTCLIYIFLFMIGIAIECSAFTTYGQLCVGRAIAGLGVGCTSGLVPVFQAEASPPSVRGLITGSFQLCVTLGIFLVNCMTYGTSKRSGEWTWRFPIGIQLVWAALLFVGFFLCPESPRFLAGKNRWDEARHNLARMRHLPEDDQAIAIEMEDIRLAKEEDDMRGNASYLECFSMKNMILYRTMIGIFIQIGQQVSGINFFFNYGTIFAGYAGIDNPYVFAIILSAVNVVMSFPGILLLDRVGRRPNLLFGCAIMFAGQICTGAVSTALPDSKEAGKALIFLCCLFVAGFASTIGPVAWVVAAEVFPTRLASKCVTIATAANWGMNVVIAFVAPIVQADIGTKITFVWAGFIAATAVFVFFCVPETAGLKIEEIDAMFISKTPAWKSRNFKARQQSEEALQAEKRSNTHNEKVRNAEAPHSPTSSEA